MDTVIIGTMNRMGLLQTVIIGENGWDLIPQQLFSLLAGESKLFFTQALQLFK